MSLGDAEAALAELGADWLDAHVRGRDTTAIDVRIADATRQYRREERRARRRPLTRDEAVSSTATAMRLAARGRR